MPSYEKTKITVGLQVAGIEKIQKQSFPHVKNQVTEAEVVALGKVLTKFAPKNTDLAELKKTQEVSYLVSE